MKIDDTHLRTVCKIGMGKDCCRYITAGAEGITCAKHSSFRDVIDQRVAAGLFTAIADNCEGLQ